MGTVDVSRFLLQTRKGFVGARLQQGRILLDSDFNEQGQLTDEDRRSFEKKEEPTGARKVVVNNYTTQYIDVQVNGYLRGQVAPSSTKVITIEQRWNPIVLKGWGDGDESTFGPCWYIIGRPSITTVGPRPRLR